MKIIYFIESLHTGGKERRLIELLSYLTRNTNYRLLVILTKKDIHYKEFYNLNIPFEILDKGSFKKRIIISLKFFKICWKFKPNVIHTWGNIVTFYSLLSAILLRIPLINSQITNAPPFIDRFTFFYFLSKINFLFSKAIVSNSIAGLESYGISTEKGIVIHNGLNLDRFNFSPKSYSLRGYYNISTKYSVIMVGSFTIYKDYDKYIDLAYHVCSLRSDITFLAVGEGKNLHSSKEKVNNLNIKNFIFTGRISNVEHILSLCDVGILFSPFGEGNSNSIIEYMASGLPVIANDKGGNRELIINDKTGILIHDETTYQITSILCDILDNENKRKMMGRLGKELINKRFTIDKMGTKFDSLYKNLSNL